VHGGGIAEVARFLRPIRRWNLSATDSGEQDGENETDYRFHSGSPSVDVVQNHPTQGLLSLSDDSTDSSFSARSWLTWRLRTMRSLGISIEENARL
jgi:hypothetical protein